MAQDDLHYNLPPFRNNAAGQTDVSFRKPDRPGVWMSARGSLAELGAALDIAEGAEVDPVKSAPDPWAQTRTFADALITPTHMLHDRAVAQWRGLLTLFALESTYERTYRLDLKTVDLTSGSRFARVMSALLPKSVLPQRSQPGASTDQLASWRQPVIVRLISGKIDEPIALLNPACLVAAGRDAAMLRIATIPWMKNGLGDPTRLTDAEALSLDRMRRIYEYVNKLREDLRTQHCVGATEDALYLSIDKALGDFADDCVDPERQPGVVDAPVAVTVGPPRGNDLPSLYRMLRRTLDVVPDGDPAVASQCLLALRTDIGALPFKGIVLVDASIAHSRGRHPNRVTLWGTTSLKDAIDGERAEIDKLRGEVAAAGYFLAEPADFFTTTMLKLDDPASAAIIAGHGAALRDTVLPLSPLALLVATPEDLKLNCSVDSDDGFTLSLALSGTKDDPRRITHRLTRNFNDEPREAEGRLRRRVSWSIGDVAIWPNFKGSQWKRYFARVSYGTTVYGKARGRLATSGAALAEMLCAIPDDSQRAEHFRSWCNSASFINRTDPVAALARRSFVGGWLDRLRSSEERFAVEEIQASTSAFEAIFLSIAPSQAEEAVPAGLVVVQPGERSSSADAAAVVAVDFGTTNTVACFDDQKPIVFGPRILHPIWSGTTKFITQSQDRIAQNFQDFFPPDARTLPTPSVVLARALDVAALTEAGDLRVDDALLFRHVVYFQPDTGQQRTAAAFDPEEWRALLDRAIFNLKWPEDPEGKTASLRFLRQVMLMIAAEAFDGGKDLHKLKWRFSRPEAILDNANFSDELRKSLESAVPGSPWNALEKMRSEGLSAANYILTIKGDRRFVLRNLNIILDIGGGTTDVAIWDDRPQLLWSGSYKLAGGDFFTSHILKNPAFLRMFKLDAWANFIAPGDNVDDAIDPTKLRSVGELLFSGATLETAFASHWGRVVDTEPVQRLIQTATVFLGGMAWYLGLVVKSLIGSGKVDDSGLDNVAVALCGRGAGLFTRLHGLDHERETLISRTLSLFAVAAGRTGTVRQPTVFVSPIPKIEVVAGMAVEGAINVQAAHAAQSLIAPAGLPIMFELPGATPVLVAAEADFGSGHDGLARPPEISAFEPFLAALAAQAGFNVALSPATRARMAQRVTQTLNVAQENDAESPGPPFIIALRELVELMTSPDERMRPIVEPVRSRR